MTTAVSETRKYRYVFTAKEDAILHSCVEQFGTTDWDRVAQEMPGRSPRQCRDRWFTYLSPDVNRSPWTTAEDGLLFDLLQSNGPKWGVLARFFCNRTQNNIKNRWNTVVKKAKALGFDPSVRRAFIEAGLRIANRTGRTGIEHERDMEDASPQERFSVGSLLN
jgi:hypothetical protein